MSVDRVLEGHKRKSGMIMLSSASLRRPLAIFRSHCANCCSPGLLPTHIFVSRVWKFGKMEGQRGEDSRAALTMSDFVQYVTTGNVCKKLPPSTVVIPLKSAWLSQMSCKDLSTALKA